MHHDENSQIGNLSFIASILVLAMFVINGGLILSNRASQENLVTVQGEIQAKSQKIQANQTFANINQSLIQALSTAAIARKDEQIKALLIQNNVDLTPRREQPAAAAPAPAAAPPAAK